MTTHRQVVKLLDMVRGEEKSIITALRATTLRGASTAELYNHRRRLSKVRQELQTLIPVDVLHAER